MRVTMDDVLTLIQTVSESNLTKFQFEDDNFSISMKASKKKKRGRKERETEEIFSEQAVSHTRQKEEPKKEAEREEETIQEEESIQERKEETKNSAYITSPLVGTFYAAKAEGEAPYVQVGDTVKKGQVIGIVEAMKLMNEVESEFDGIVAEILVENEQMVEYEQPLVRLERR